MNGYLPPLATSSSTDVALALLAVLGDPARTKSLIGNIVAERQKLEAAAGNLQTLETERTALDKARAEHEAERIKHAEQHASSVAELTRRYLQHDRDQAELQKQADALGVERAAFEHAKREHENRLAQVEKLRAALA
jgi:hypothetical protein